jgi:predicted amidophosphoribosyltransferase
MTERAKRAAKLLISRGWQLDSPDGSMLDKDCPNCHQQIRSDSRFCSNCGSTVPWYFNNSSLEDLEAAIAFAVDGRA